MNHKWGDLSLTEITGMTRAMTVELLIFSGGKSKVL
jgi:hypothetical protein